MRSIANIALACVLYTVLLCYSAAAQTGCVPAVAFLQAAAPQFSEVLILDGTEETKTASQIFNAIPPESNDHWPLVVLASLKIGGGVLLVGRDQTICGHVQFRSQEWEAVMRSVRGFGA